MKAIAYYRVSTDLQDYNRQIQDIQTYCNKEGFNVVKEFAEKETGKNKKRPALDEMLEYCRVNKPEFLVVSELSRLGRNTQIPLITEELSNLKICIITLKENLRTLNSDGTINHTANLIIDVMSGINRYELTTINYRIKSGLKSAVKAGKAMSAITIPYGYQKLNKMLVIDPIESEVIKQIYSLYSQGTGAQTICKLLDNQGIKPKYGLSWGKSIILQILKNPVYIGKRRFSKNLYDAPELQIIDVETYDKCTNTRVKRANTKEINKKYEYLLNKEIIWCGCCNKPFFGNKMGRTNTYKCLTNRYGTKKCDSHTINREKMDLLTTKILTLFFPFQLTKNVDLTELKQEISRLENIIYGRESEQKQTVKDEQKLIELALQGFNQDIINTRLDQIRKRQEKAKADIIVAGEQIKAVKKQIQHKSNYKAMAREIETNGISKDLVHRIISKIVITPAIIQLNQKSYDNTLKIDYFIDNNFISIITTQRKDDNTVIIEDFSDSIIIVDELGKEIIIEKGQEMIIEGNNIVL